MKKIILVLFILVLFSNLSFGETFENKKAEQWQIVATGMITTATSYITTHYTYGERSNNPNMELLYAAYMANYLVQNTSLNKAFNFNTIFELTGYLEGFNSATIKIKDSYAPATSATVSGSDITCDDDGRDYYLYEWNAGNIQFERTAYTATSDSTTITWSGIANGTYVISNSNILPTSFLTVSN